jgi:hypothetical protein
MDGQSKEDIMGKRILVGIVGLLALVGGGVKAVAHSAEHATTYVDDAVKAERGLGEHRPPPIHVPVPRPGAGASEASEAVERWTSDLSLDDAKKVLGIACKLSEAFATQAQVQLWTYQNGYAYREDEVQAIQGLVKEMRENPGVKLACKAAG